MSVGFQPDNRIVIIETNVTSGVLGSIVASIVIAGHPTSVIWDE